LYTPPVTPREFATPEVGEVTFTEPAAEGGADDWGEVVTRYPYRKVGMDHLLSKELFLEQTYGIPDEQSSRDVKD
jgi:hypothetical protein